MKIRGCDLLVLVMIGLSGRQPVRDLWQRKDLGVFTDSFTAKGRVFPVSLREKVLLRG